MFATEFGGGFRWWTDRGGRVPSKISTRKNRTLRSRRETVDRLKRDDISNETRRIECTLPVTRVSVSLTLVQVANHYVESVFCNSGNVTVTAVQVPYTFVVCVVCRILLLSQQVLREVLCSGYRRLGTVISSIS